MDLDVGVDVDLDLDLDDGGLFEDVGYLSFSYVSRSNQESPSLIALLHPSDEFTKNNFLRDVTFVRREKVGLT